MENKFPVVLKRSAGLLIVPILIFILLGSIQVAFAQEDYPDFSFKYQEEDNYCGIALMQTFVPSLSQDSIANELHKWKYDLTYWGDFIYFFNKHRISYHFTKLGEEFPAIVLLRGSTFGLRQNHYVLVLDKKHNFYYIFDPTTGFYKKPYYYLEGSIGLVVE
jgi:hypothetical protein